MSSGSSPPFALDRTFASYGDAGFSRFLRRAFLASAGYDRLDVDRPVVGIADTSSDFNPCHRQMPELVAAVKRGVLEAGGLPFAFPTISLAESFLSPTSMLYRNLAAMETEEMIRAQPMDAVVLLGGCDKTVPAQLMASASANLPALLVVTGPMLTGTWRGERLGACTDCRRMWAAYRAGDLDEAQLDAAAGALTPTAGTCTVMGTASTMACVAEALGMMLAGGASAPAATGSRLAHAVASGRRAVELARGGPRPLDILKPAAFANALVVLAAVSGSTNAIVHLLALARRAGVHLELVDFDRVARQVPLLVDCKPAGRLYLEDFHHAGGMPTLMKALEPLLDATALRVDGLTVGDLLRRVAPPPPFQRCIRTLDDPLAGPGAIAVLRGSLAPGGAVLKAATATPELMRHRGPALVFESPADADLRLNDRGLQVTPDHVLVLRNTGPAAAGMPEAGSMPIPRALAERGVRDMVRVSDARMSGTAYGTVILHCSPEAARGGAIALVRDGDLIELDVGQRRLDLLVTDDEMSRRRQAIELPKPPARGWRRLHFEHVLPADEGADLDLLAEPE